MAIEGAMSQRDLMAALDAPDWSVVLQAVAAADTRIRGSMVGDPEIEEIVAKLVGLATHRKWEVRRAVANAAAHAPHPIFETVLANFILDDNSRVRQAAEQAALRRRDSRHASTLGKQHEDRINSILDDIEARFGGRGRDAVKRAAEQIANIFARELYHEVVKLLSPLAVSAERLRAQLSAANVPAEALAEEAGPHRSACGTASCCPRCDARLHFATRTELQNRSSTRSGSRSSPAWRLRATATNRNDRQSRFACRQLSLLKSHEHVWYRLLLTCC